MVNLAPITSDVVWELDPTVTGITVTGNIDSGSLVFLQTRGNITIEGKIDGGSQVTLKAGGNVFIGTILLVFSVIFPFAKLLALLVTTSSLARLSPAGWKRQLNRRRGGRNNLACDSGRDSERPTVAKKSGNSDGAKGPY